MLNAFVVSSFPYIEENKRKSLKSKLEKQADIRNDSGKSSKVSNEDLDQWLRGVLGG